MGERTAGPQRLKQTAEESLRRRLSALEGGCFGRPFLRGRDGVRGNVERRGGGQIRADVGGLSPSSCGGDTPVEVSQLCLFSIVRPDLLLLLLLRNLRWSGIGLDEGGRRKGGGSVGRGFVRGSTPLATAREIGRRGDVKWET